MLTRDACRKCCKADKRVDYSEDNPFWECVADRNEAINIRYKHVGSAIPQGCAYKFEHAIAETLARSGEKRESRKRARRKVRGHRKQEA